YGLYGAGQIAEALGPGSERVMSPGQRRIAPKHVFELSAGPRPILSADERGGEEQPCADRVRLSLENRAQLLDRRVDVTHAVERQRQRRAGVDVVGLLAQHFTERAGPGRDVTASDERLRAFGG